MSPEQREALPGALRREGWVHIPGVLSSRAIERSRKLARRILRPQRDAGYQAAHRSIGSLFDILDEPGFVDLIASTALLGALRTAGCRDPRFEHGIVFNKLPNTPRTFWHQDGTAWSHACAYEQDPTEVIAIVYLCDADPSNGCLRVLPGSHRARHPLHGLLAARSTPELRRAAEPGEVAYATVCGEVDVPVCAGDLVVIDSRLLHAAHANTTRRDRTALSLWYVPDPDALAECVRARFDRVARRGDRLPYVPAHWTPAAAARLEGVLPPRYAGDVSPLPMTNVPDERLR